MGLVLNASKCELIADSKMVVADRLLASFGRVEVEKSSLLGAPMFPGKTLDDAWWSRCADLTRARDRLPGQLPRCIEPLEGVFQHPIRSSIYCVARHLLTWCGSTNSMTC